MTRRTTRLALLALAIPLITAFTAPQAGAQEPDCRPVLSGAYESYDGILAVQATLPAGCPPTAARLIVFTLPPGVAALTLESLDAPQTVLVIVDDTLTPGAVTPFDPGALHGCAELQIDLVPNSGQWAELRVGDVAPPRIPWAWTASAERLDDQCQPPPTSTTTVPPPTTTTPAPTVTPTTDPVELGLANVSREAPPEFIPIAASPPPFLPATGGPEGLLLAVAALSVGAPLTIATHRAHKGAKR